MEQALHSPWSKLGGKLENKWRVLDGGREGTEHNKFRPHSVAIHITPLELLTNSPTALIILVSMRQWSTQSVAEQSALQSRPAAGALASIDWFRWMKAAVSAGYWLPSKGARIECYMLAAWAVNSADGLVLSQLSLLNPCPPHASGTSDAASCHSWWSALVSSAVRHTAHKHLPSQL